MVPKRTCAGSGSKSIFKMWKILDQWRSRIRGFVHTLRTGIKWTGGSGMSKLLVVDADAGLPSSKQAVLIEKKAMRATIKSNEILATISASGKTENIVAPWRKE